MGHDALSSRLKCEEGAAWGFSHDAASVFVFLTTSDEGDNYIQVVAPIVRLPREGIDPSLYRHLLELNGSELTGVAFGIRDGDVVITADRSTLGLDAVEVEEMIERVRDYAAQYRGAIV